MINQLLLNRFWPNFKGRFQGSTTTITKSTTTTMAKQQEQLQQNLRSYWPDFEHHLQKTHRGNKLFIQVITYSILTPLWSLFFGTNNNINNKNIYNNFIGNMNDNNNDKRTKNNKQPEQIQQPQQQQQQVNNLTQSYFCTCPKISLNSS